MLASCYLRALSLPSQSWSFYRHPGQPCSSTSAKSTPIASNGLSPGAQADLPVHALTPGSPVLQ